jgi:Family of unknown function (DUF6515)/Bacterial SH3 domain
MIFKNRLAKGFMAVALCIAVLGYAVQGFAKPPRHKRPRAFVRHPIPKYGRAVVRLPPRHRNLMVNRTRYFFDSGIFYREGPRGYVVVRAPLGAILASVPVGSVTFALGGTPYWYYSGAYYRRVPSGYTVVDAPPNAVIAEESDDRDVVGERVSITAQSLNVRSGPGGNHAVIAHLQYGTTLVVRGYSPGWLYVELPHGRFGWIMKKFTSFAEPLPSG